jgi:hypothetical protein
MLLNRGLHSLDNDFLKKQYFKDFEELRKMMNDWDPMALVALGCPEDEYDEYTNRVLSILYRYKGNPNEVQGKLSDYLKLFDEDIKELEMKSKGEFLTMKVEEFTERITNWFNNR